MAFKAQIAVQKGKPDDNDGPRSRLGILHNRSYLCGAGSLVFFAVAAGIAIAGFAFADATLELTCPKDGAGDCAIVCRDGTVVAIGRGDSVTVRPLANGLSIAISGSETRTELLAPAPDETCRFVDFAEPHWMTRWPWM